MNETSAESLSDASSAESFLAELLKITTQATPVLLESDEEPRCLPTNASCACHTLYEPYDPLEVVVIGLVALPLFVFGLIANITSVRIFTHRLMASSPINWYLAVLSVSDTFILISSFFVLTLPRLGEFMTWWRANFISYSVSPLMFGMMNLSQTVSVCMTVGVSVHRYIGVCHPYKSVELLSRKRVIWFITSLVTFSFLFNLSRFFEVKASSVCYRENIGVYLPSITLAEFRLSELYLTLYLGWTYTIIMFMIPFALLIGLNSVVLAAVRRSRRMHMISQCSGENDEFSKKGERKERQTSIMLVAIVLLFISCNVWAFLCNIMEKIEVSQHLYQHFIIICNFLVIVNASFNICIYMLFSEKYRLLLRHYMRCDWSRHGGELLISSVAG